MDVEIKGLDSVCAALNSLRNAAPNAARAAMHKCGERCKAQASLYAPRSPTKSQYNEGLKRKKRTQRKYVTPGNLEKSVACEYDDSHASVFIASNGMCVSPKGYNYAKKIHDERGKTWQKLGRGSQAKNARAQGKVGDKFIERAIRDNVDFCYKVIDERLNAALKKAWGWLLR